MRGQENAGEEKGEVAMGWVKREESVALRAVQLEIRATQMKHSK